MGEVLSLRVLLFHSVSFTVIAIALLRFASGAALAWRLVVPLALLWRLLRQVQHRYNNIRFLVHKGNATGDIKRLFKAIFDDLGAVRCRSLR